MDNNLIDVEDYEKTLTWNYYNTSAFTDFKEIYKDAKLTFDEWVNLMLAFDKLDSDSRLDAAIVSIKEENKRYN